jgi:hypothetical protein
LLRYLFELFIQFIPLVILIDDTLYLGDNDTLYYAVAANHQQQVVDLYADYTTWKFLFDSPFKQAVALENTVSMVWWFGGKGS